MEVEWKGGEEKRPTDVKLWYTVYNGLKSGPSENNVWKSCDIPVDDNGNLSCDFWNIFKPRGLEFIEEEWLDKNLT